MNQDEKNHHINSLSPSNWDDSVQQIKLFCYDESNRIVSNAIATLDEYPDFDTFNFLTTAISQPRFTNYKDTIWLSLRNYYSQRLEEIANVEIYSDEKDHSVLHHIAIHLKYFDRKKAIKYLIYLLWEFPDNHVNVFAADSLYWHNDTDLYDEWVNLTNYGHFYVEKVARQALADLQAHSKNGVNLYKNEITTPPSNISSSSAMLEYALQYSRDQNILNSVRVSDSDGFQLLVPSIVYDNQEKLTNDYHLLISRARSVVSITFDYVSDLEQSLLTSQIVINHNEVIRYYK